MGGTGAAALITPEVAAFLDRRRVAHLATADESGRPHVVPIVYARSGATLYTAIDVKPKRRPPRELRRVRNILANPRVAVVMDAYDEDWTRLAYVLLSGSARLLEDGAEHADALRRLREKYPQYLEMPLEDRPVIAMDVESVAIWGAVADDPGSPSGG